MPSPERSGLQPKPRLLDNTVANIWFSPKPFESEHLYSLMGVGLYQRYLPTSGDLINKHYAHKNRPRPSYLSMHYQGAEAIDYRTRQVEAAHIALSVPFLMLMYSFAEHGNMIPLAVTTLAQAVVNVYPVLLSRRVRLRTQRVLEWRKSRQNITPNLES